MIKIPTGYTQSIIDGITFPEFAMRCARNFGALIEMREDPLDAQVPEEFKPSNYHTEAIKEAEIKLKKLQKMPLDCAENESYGEFQKKCDDKDRRNIKNAKQKEKYEEMLKKVESWNPPTEDHIGLKQFMVSQIEESIRFDVNFDESVPIKLSGKEWKEKEIKRCFDDIKYHSKENIKEQSRTAERNTWVKLLRESLKECKP